MQRAVRHAAIVADYAALRAASRTALQDFQARSDRRRQEALDTAARERAPLRAPTAQLSSRRGRRGSHGRCMSDGSYYYSQGRRHRGARACARARCRGSCCCEQRADRYYRFTLEGEAAPPPLEPPPTNGLCNSRLCAGHASAHSDSGSRAWGSGGCARCVEQQQQQQQRRATSDAPRTDSYWSRLGNLAYGAEASATPASDPSVCRRRNKLHSGEGARLEATVDGPHHRRWPTLGGGK